MFPNPKNIVENSLLHLVQVKFPRKNLFNLLSTKSLHLLIYINSINVYLLNF